MGRDLGRLLQQRRYELGLSRRELADRSGVSYPYVSQIETGDREPSLKTMHVLAQVLEIPIEQMAARTSPSEWLTSTAVDASALAVPAEAGRPSTRGRSRRTSPPALNALGSDDDTAAFDPVEMWRDKVMPSLERRLSSVPPVERIALLNELLSQAVEELVADQADRSRPRR